MVDCWRASRSVGRARAEAANSTAVANIDLKSILMSEGMYGYLDGCRRLGRKCMYDSERVIRYSKRMESSDQVDASLQCRDRVGI